jgi:peptidoglycan/LPS O-acetylase OafA/YrhL
MPLRPHTTVPSSADAGRFELLDGLRFAAASAVFLFHLAFRAWNETVPGHVEYLWLGHVAKYGYLGVDLFFMISGFVILMSASRGSAREFLLSRVVRLYPAYWFCVAATYSFLVLWYWKTDAAPDPIELLSNLTMFQSAFGMPHLDGSYWTLVVELHFYAVILVVLATRQLAHIDGILAGWLLAGIAADFVPVLKAGSSHYAAPWCHYFVAGALAYRIHEAGLSRFRILFFGLAFVQAARHAHWYMHLKQKLTQVPFEVWVVQVLVAAMFAVFLLLAMGRLQLRLPALRKLGTLTYPLYLIHGLIGSTVLVAWVRDHQGNRWVALGVVTAISLAAAWFINRFIERPGAPRLRRLLASFLLRRALPVRG